MGRPSSRAMRPSEPYGVVKVRSFFGVLTGKSASVRAPSEAPAVSSVRSPWSSILGISYSRMVPPSLISGVAMQEESAMSAVPASQEKSSRQGESPEKDLGLPPEVQQR